MNGKLRDLLEAALVARVEYVDLMDPGRDKNLAVEYAAEARFNVAVDELLDYAMEIIDE